MKVYIIIKELANVTEIFPHFDTTIRADRSHLNSHPNITQNTKKKKLQNKDRNNATALLGTTYWLFSVTDSTHNL